MSPILFTVYFVNTLHFYKEKGFSWGMFIEDTSSIIIIVISILLLFICQGLICYASKNLESFTVKIKSVRPMDNETFSFLLAYLLPLVSRSSIEINIEMLIFFVAIFFLVIHNSHSYHFNPLFSLFGYHCYEISTDNGLTYAFLTKRKMQKCGKLSEIVHITDYMILEGKQ